MGHHRRTATENPGDRDKDRDKHSRRDNTRNPSTTKPPRNQGGSRRDRPENCAATPKYQMHQPEAMAQAESWAQRTLRRGVNGLVEDFAQLKPYMPPDVSTKAYQAHPDKNRYPDVWCEDKSRVVLKWPPGRPTDYIHAKYVATHNLKKRFICTQGPLPNTVADFWSMIVQEECEFVLMLCSVEENGMPKCAQYWPLKEGDKVVHERVEVTNLKVEQPPPNTDETSLRRTTLELKYAKEGKSRTRKVRHFHWTDWPDRGVPKTSLTAMVLLSCVRGSKRPIAIHCAAGIGRTGSITSIEYIIEHFTDGRNCEDMVEIVKGLRQQRLSSIQNSQQYLYVHRVLLMYFIDKYKAVAQSPDMEKLYQQFKDDYCKVPGISG